MNKPEITVLVVEDSAVARELLVGILDSDPGIRVVGTARTGEEAVRLLSRTRPDVVTMDIHMPGMNGFEATRRIMRSTPVPIVIVTSDRVTGDRSLAFKAVEAGAVAILEKPSGVGQPGFQSELRAFVDSIKAMSEVKVVTRRTARPAPRSDAETRSPEVPEERRGEIRAVAIGVSTGGPQVLQAILDRLPPAYSIPILVVQHISSGFTESLVEWLNGSSPLSVRVAEDGSPVRAGHVHVAPHGSCMRVDRSGKIALHQGGCPSGPCPSVAELFQSVAEVHGSRAAGVLLTGMGKDGARELLLMRERGAVTIAQDEESSVVHGMPGEAIRLGAAKYVLNPEQIVHMLASLANCSKLENA